MSESSLITQQRNKYRLSRAKSDDDGGWTKHSEIHWSRTLNGHRLDYWPSTSRFKYKDRMYREFYSGRDGVKSFKGSIQDFIKDHQDGK